MLAGQDQRRRMAMESRKSFLENTLWYQVNSLSKSHPVGHLKRNDFGLFDMHGNAWEWCDDVLVRGPGASPRVYPGRRLVLQSPGTAGPASATRLEPGFPEQRPRPAGGPEFPSAPRASR